MGDANEISRDQVQDQVQDPVRQCLVFLPANACLNFNIKELDAPQTQYNDRSVDYGRDNVATIVRGTYGKNHEKQLEHVTSRTTGL